MKVFTKTLSQREILAVCGGSWQGESAGAFDSVGEIAEASATSIVFCEQERLVEAASQSAAGLIICNPALAPSLGQRPLLIVDKPYFSLMKLITWWLQMDGVGARWEIHPSAIIHPEAIISENVAIGAFTVIGKNARIASGVRIGDKCTIEANCVIGANTLIYPQVSIREDCVIGESCIIHNGVVIGADGFGFLLMDGIQQKIPQVGNVVIHNHVEIGANSCIDRATLGSTIIGEGTKIDNLVQIGHNTVVGKHSILCAQVGLAGSTIVGDYVYLAGQVGAAGHITIGSKAMVGAQSGISGDVPAGARYFGTPAIDAGTMKRIVIAQRHLPEIFRAYQKQSKDNEK